ncbi:MAG: hypothetical protein ACOH2V_01150 [Candidatus Saccharimonadaceae bacterium]
MEMKNVGYLNTDSNDAYVSVWQIFIQGSDFDIDKAYIMGHGFNKAGHFELWNDMFTYTSKESLDVLETMPMPSKTAIKTIVNESEEGVVDITKDFAALTTLLTAAGIDSVEFSTIVKLNFDAKTLKVLKTILERTSKEAKISIVFDANWTPEQLASAKIHQDFLKALLNKYNTSRDYTKNKFSTVNSIVSGIKSIISSASNQIYANKPVDTKALHRGAEDAEVIKAKKLKEKVDAILGRTNKGEGNDPLTSEILSEIQNLYKVVILNPAKFETVGKALIEAQRIHKIKRTLSAHDMLSMFKQQVDASVGKIDVGIGANGLKVMFALNNYYNNYYKTLAVDEEDTLSNADGTPIDVQTDPKWFKKTFVMGEPLGTVTRTAIADVKLDKKLIRAIAKGYGLDSAESQLGYILNGEAALYASGFVSGATDNAKELIMAKINAIEKLASMHLYLMIMGFTSEEVATYMNSDLASYVVESLGSINIYDTDEGNVKEQSIPNIVSEYKKNNPEDEAIANTFLDIFAGAGEFGSLAGILKINQSTSADTANLFLYLGKFNKAIYAREHDVLGESLIHLQTGYKIENVVKKIIAAHPNTLTEEYVKEVLGEANNITVAYINAQGTTETKNVSMVGGQFDVRFYIHPDNQVYRDVAIKYYNLFKNTINIFDVVENSPHFKAMINGLSITHNKALITSGKYNFVFNYASDIIREKSASLYKNNQNKTTQIKTLFGNAALPIDLTEKEFGRLLKGYDSFLIASWLKEADASNYKFNVQDLLIQAGEDSIVLYNSDNAKMTPIGDNNNSTVTVTKGSENFIVDLTTDFGIANFKRIMEQLILPILQRSKKANLGSQLRTKSVRNPFGLYTTQIAAVFGLSSLDSEVNLAKYQELLNDFNEVDFKIEDENKIKGIGGKGIKFQDLLYMYNLIVNDESFGDNRLTAIFQDYIKNPDTIAYDYLNYSTRVDLKEVDIFEIKVDPAIINENEKESIHDKLVDSLTNDIVFLALHQRGQLSLRRLNNNAVQDVVLQNPDFIINTFMDVKNNKETIKYNNLQRLTALLRDSNLLIHFKCN